MVDPTPFATAADAYLAAGWVGVLPLPARAKKSPPTGYTGDTGAYPTVADLTEWRTHQGTGNIGLRMAAGVIGIDVDNYGTKPGSATLARLEDDLGPLPDTAMSTSRTDGVSGIRFYRLPEPVKLIGALPGIEIIQRHHRYAVVAPSIHPEGREYRWIGPGGEIIDVPNVDDLPELPAAWVDHLRADNHTPRQRQALAAGVDVAPAVERALGAAMIGMHQGTRHDTTLRGVVALTRLADQGYPGADGAIRTLEATFLAAVTADGSRTDRDAQSEWDRMVTSANDQVAQVPAIIPRWEPATPPPDPDALGLTSIGPETVDARPWDEPRSLPEPPAPAAFPVESLPAWTQAHAVAAADQVQVPVDLTAMLIIGALSAATTGRARVHVSPNWSEPVNLYLVTAMRSGAGKSPAAKLTTDWLYRWQRERIEAVRVDHDRAQLKVRHARKKLNKIVDGGLAVDDAEVFAAHAEVATAEEAVPPLPRLIADDATPEAIATLMRDHGQRLAVLSTEADLFDMLLRGKPGQRANVNIYLKAWSGDPFIRDRKGGSEGGAEWTELASPLLTVAVTVQPSVLAKVQSDAEMTGRGFAARFMFAMPPDLIGRRDQTRRFQAERLATTDPYDAEATRLATRMAGWICPVDLHMDDESARLMEAFLVEVEPRLAAGEDYEGLGEWVNKLHGSIARYAGLLHLCEERDVSAPITADTTARAIELGRYWLANSVAVLGLEVERTAEQAQAVLEWVARNGSRFTPAMLQANLRRPGLGFDKVTDFVPALDLLIDLGWIRPVDNEDWKANLGIRRSKSPDFALWPAAVGKSPSVNKPRKPRTASMGERDSLPPPLPTTPTPPSTRYAVYAETDTEPGPVDNPAPAASTDWMDL